MKNCCTGCCSSLSLPSQPKQALPNLIFYCWLLCECSRKATTW